MSAMKAGSKPWSVAVRPGDYLIPVCHQGLNRSQIIRLALRAAIRTLGQDPDQWVAEAHGALSGCDAHTAFQVPPRPPAPTWAPARSRMMKELSSKNWLTPSPSQDVHEDNFFGYLHDPGDIFETGYDPASDTDPQRGPLQRGWLESFGCEKPARLGEEMAGRLVLNPTSERTSFAEFGRISRDRTVTHRWFNDRCVVRDSNLGHQLLLPPAHWCPIFAPRAT